MKPVFVPILIGGVLSFLLATSLTWSSFAIPKLTSSTLNPLHRTIDVEESSWVTSILTLGCIIGNYLLCFLAEHFGKKPVILISGLVVCICNILMAFAETIQLFYIGRFFTGIIVGGIFTLMPLYAGELGQTRYRGVLAISLAVPVSGGLLLSNALGPFVSFKVFHLVLASLSVLFFILFNYFGQEVPQYYMKVKKEHLAKVVFEKLWKETDDKDQNFNNFQNNFKENESGKVRDLFATKSLRKGFFICVTLLAFQQLSGMETVMFYGQKLFVNLDSSISPEISVIILSTAHFISSFIAPVLSVNYNRKTLLISSGLGMILSEGCLVIFTYLETKHHYSRALNILPLICLIVFILAFNTGFAVLPWTLLAEMFPPKLTTLSAAVATTVYWLMGFIITKYFLQLINIIGLHGYFATCAIFCILATVFVKVLLVETRNKTVEEIQKELSM